MIRVIRTIHAEDYPCQRLSETRAPLRDRDRPVVAVVVVLLGNGAVLAARRAGSEDRRASDKMTIDIGVRGCRRERRQRVTLAGWRWRCRMRVRVRMWPAVVDTRANEGRRWRRDRRRYRRLGTRGHHRDIGWRYRTWQCPGARQGTGTSAGYVSGHYVTGRAHGRGIIGPTSWIAKRGRCRARIAVVADVAPSVVHLHAIEAHVVGRRRARVPDVTRLRHCNVRRLHMGILEDTTRRQRWKRVCVYVYVACWTDPRT